MNNWPSDFHKLQTAGIISRLTDPDDPLMIWDADFLSTTQIAGFERLEDQILDITPFAESCRGDYWAYLTDSLPDSRITLCYHDSYQAEYVARDFAGFLFRQTITFAGTEGLSPSGGSWSIQTAKQQIGLICSCFAEFLPSAMIAELQQIASTPNASVRNGRTTLIPDADLRRLLDGYCDLGRKDVCFQWRS